MGLQRVGHDGATFTSPGCHWASGSVISILPEVVISIPISQMANLRVQRMYSPGSRIQRDETRVQTWVCLPLPLMVQRMLHPVLPAMLVGAEKNRLPSLSLKPQVSGLGPVPVPRVT